VHHNDGVDDEFGSDGAREERIILTKDEKKETANKDERRSTNSKACSRNILFTKSYCAQKIQFPDENRCRSWIVAWSTILPFGAQTAV
jgi:hypothetical protein